VEKPMEVPQNIQIKLQYHPDILLLGTFPKE
jgi:hypothetical protein